MSLSYSLVAISSAIASLLSWSFINKYCMASPNATSMNCSLVYSFNVNLWNRDTNAGGYLWNSLQVANTRSFSLMWYSTFLTTSWISFPSSKFSNMNSSLRGFILSTSSSNKVISFTLSSCAFRPEIWITYTSVLHPTEPVIYRGSYTGKHCKPKK